MKRTFIILFSILITTALTSVRIQAQQTRFADDPEALFRTGMKLFEKEKYGAAMEMFDRILESEEEGSYLLMAEAEYYRAVSALYLYNPGGQDKLNRFMADNKQHTRVRSANYILGSHQFDRKRYSTALRSLEKVNVFDLEKNQVPDYYFMLGYCQFRAKKYKEAAAAFAKANNKGAEFGSLAKYFSAHIAYANGDYDAALQGFEQLKDDPMVQPLMPYYVTQIYYLKGDYQKLLETAPTLLETASKSRQPEIARLIGDAYFRTGNFASAIPYLEQYYDESYRRGSREDRYQLGYAYYRTGDYTKAIENLKDVTYTDDSLCQNAYYHLADCFVETGDRKQAIDAFYSAYKLGFDPVIAEDALFNYAKLSYELSYNPYNQAVRAFQEYIEKYPKSKRIDEANSYLVSLFLSTRNYKSALESIEGIKNKDAQLMKALQRIYYYRGIELFNDGDISGALDLFDKAIKGNNDPVITAGARFWSGEGLFRSGENQAAIRQMNVFKSSRAALKLPFYEQVNYNLGYAWFKQNNYSSALSSFTDFLKDPGSAPARLISDARLRTGDCHYMNRSYSNAIHYYDEVISKNEQDVDYALYQKAMATRIMGNHSISSQVFTRLVNEFPRSPYVDDAYFLIGDNYMTYQGKPQMAIESFEKIITKNPQSPYVKRALLRIGLIHFTAHENQKALENFERVAEEYPGTQESKDAIEFIRNIYIELDQVDQFFTWVQTLPNAKVTNSEADSTTFTAAENNYMKGNCDRAAKGFGEYLAKFPKGIFQLEAHFYKAECEAKLGNTDKAITDYQFVVDYPSNRFTEEALKQAASLNYRQKNYKKALDLYTRIEATASYKTDILDARQGQMRCYAGLKDHEGSIRAARKLLMSDRATVEMGTEAHLLIGRSALALDSIDLALVEFTEVARRTSSEDGAEAKFQIAEIQFRKNQLSTSEKTCFELIDQYSSYDYWMARTFILLSDIYVKNDNAFQAKHTLQSIIDNYKGQDDIVNIARGKLSKIIEAENSKNKPPDEEDDQDLEEPEE